MFSVSKEYINCRCGLHLDEYQSVCPNTGKLGIINSNGKIFSIIIYLNENLEFNKAKEDYDKTELMRFDFGTRF